MAPTSSKTPPSKTLPAEPISSCPEECTTWTVGKGADRNGYIEAWYVGGLCLMKSLELDMDTGDMLEIREIVS